MISDIAAITARIVLEPAEDLHRLALADALDERDWPGDALRAKVIKLQIERIAERGSIERTHELCREITACWPDAPMCPPLTSWWASEIYWHNEREGTRSYVGTMNEAFANGGAKIERGMASVVQMGWRQWLQHADALTWRPDQNRECPETAQPLEQVTISDTVPPSENGLDRLRAWREDLSRYFRWIVPEPDDSTRNVPDASYWTYQHLRTLFRNEWPWLKFVFVRYPDD